MNTSHLKFQKKCMCVFHTQLFYKFPTGFHNSFNPRPEFIVGMNDELSVHVGHYLQDLGLEVGQGVMRLCIDLSLKFAPHLKDYNLVSWEARFPSTSGFFRLARLDDFSCVGALCR